MEKILFLGNIPANHPNSIGGANTYTQELLNEILKNQQLEIQFQPIRTRWYKGGQIIDFFFLIFKIPLKLIKCDVISIHASWDFHLSIGPFIVLFSRILNKKVVYHFFGGKFHEMYHEYPWLIQRWLDVSIFKSDFKLMETKRMISYFKKKSFKGFVWFPNSRKSLTKAYKSNKFSNKFVFISRVTPTKGVDFILETSKTLPPNYTIDLYGPLDSRYYTKDYFKAYNVRYLGTLKPNKVLNTLSQYDVLLLPTFYEGEGYPGIIIEAMSLGKPVICSQWNALDELVEDNVNGKLIKPKSTKDLKNAMESFNESNYQNISNNARLRFIDFNINSSVEKLVKLYLDND